MPLSPGDKLGPYECIALIGKGGMGEVWKARDPRVGRDVAIKISQEHFSERFEREARAIGALNHPNICTLYDVGPNYLVMEYVEGAPLKGPLPLDQALKYAVQICDALDAAHKKGITHRDLKPANILVTKAGIKLLDFGLAKLASSATGSSPKPDDATLTMALTGKNEIVGTLYYMSPEQLQAQANGQEIDGRSDIFSFGIVLYEMLTGKRAFEGSSPASVIAAIMERPAPSIADVAPPALDRVLRKCLAKDLDEHWQTARDLKDELEWMASGPEAGSTLPAAQNERSRLGSSPWIVCGAFALAAIALGIVSYRHVSEEPPRVLKLSVLPPKNGTFNGRSLPAVSPDGRRLVFAAILDGKDQLWVRDLDSLAARALPGTEDADDPFWSPDSRFIAFFADRKLKKIDVAGGPAVTLCDEQGRARGGTWGKNDVIVFAGNPGGLYSVPAAGGSVTPVVAPGRFPWFLPDGRHFLYTSGQPDGTAEIFVADLDSNQRELVLVAGSNAIYTSPGHLLFLRDTTLMAQPFDARSGKATGEAVPIGEQVDSIRSNFQGNFSASLGPDNGVAAYMSGITQGDQLTWFDRSGKTVGTTGGPGIGNNPAISPDGNTIVFQRGDTRTGVVDLWLVAGSAESRFTLDRSRNRSPVWSPDGNYIAFDSPRKIGTPDIFVKAVRGSAGLENGEVALATPAGNLVDGFPDDWTHDGRYIVAQFGDPKTKQDLWLLPWPPEKGGTGRAPIPYLQTPFNEQDARVSPNGRWLAYASDESGQFEVYVQTFPTAGDKSQVSTHGGTLPVWSRDGKELFFIGADRKMTAVEVKGAAMNDQAAFQLREPKILFDTPSGSFGRFDVSKDGRFLLPAPAEQSANAPMTVVVNWRAGLKK